VERTVVRGRRRALRKLVRNLALARGMPLPHESRSRFGDSKAGPLIGPAFAFTYVVFRVPVGLLVDHASRRMVVVGGLLIWTFAVLSSAFAASFVVLFLLRALVGAGEATSTPSAHSLLSDLFPREKRGGPFSIFQFGGPMGFAIAFAGGGALLDWYGKAGPWFVFGRPLHGWQAVFLAVGLPGLLLAFLPPLLPEPRRSGAVETRVGSIPVGPFVRQNARVLTPMFLLFACSITVSYAQSSWTAEYMRRSFHWSSTRIGSTMGLINFAMPLISQISASFLVDRLSSRGPLDAPIRLLLIMVIIGYPFLLAEYLIPVPAVFLVSACAGALTITPTLAFGNIALQQFTPTALRGRMSGAFLAFFSLAGLTIGPGAVGAASEFGFKDPSKLGWSIGLVVGLAGLLVIALAALALGPLRDAIGRANRGRPAA
jgi:MFS family permease